MKYRLGIDVGGTNTDAVILDEQQTVVASIKTHTTADIEAGIDHAIAGVLAESGIAPADIHWAMLGTTQATNAIVERKELARVGVIRLGYPATVAIPPYTEWPDDIVQILSGQYALVHGGYEYDGQTLTIMDNDELREVLTGWQGKVDALAVVGVFSALNKDQEEHVAAVAQETLGADIPVSLSATIGSIGLIPRENATILNAALYKVIQRVTRGFSEALRQRGVNDATVYLCQNDGTVMSLDFAAQYPILTIGSGPTNSIRGAAYLAQKKNALVLDIGGTTSDIGVLVNNFPRESSKGVEVGGVQTNFRMPDILSIGLGGGSIVRQHADGSVTVGPDSVGYRITEQARCFGGDVLTATDIAVRLGNAALGDPSLVADLDDDLVQKAAAEIRLMLEEAIDKMKPSAEDVDLILVGGGMIIVHGQLAGTAHTYTDSHGGVANAIGATIAQVGGQYEKLYQYANVDRAKAIADATALAERQAVTAGAIPESTQVVDVEEIPLAYAPGDTTRVKARAVGQLK